MSLDQSFAGGTQGQRTKPPLGTKCVLWFKHVTQLAGFIHFGGGGFSLHSPGYVILLWEAGPRAGGGEDGLEALPSPYSDRSLEAPGGRAVLGSPLPPSFPGEGQGRAAPVCDLAGTCCARGGGVGVGGGGGLTPLSPDSTKGGSHLQPPGSTLLSEEPYFPWAPKPSLISSE